MSGWHVKMMGKLRSIISTCDIRYVADFAVSQRLYRAYADTWLLMAAHSNGQAIIFCSCGFFLPVVFSLAYSQRSESGCTPYFHTWCGLSANLECMSEMCCTRLAENTGRKKYVKKSSSAHNRTTLSGHIFATKACVDNLKKYGKRN